MNALLSLLTLFITSPFLRRVPTLGIRTRLGLDPADQQKVEDILREGPSRALEESRQFRETLESTGPSEFFQLVYTEEREKGPEFVGKVIARMAMNRLKMDVIENFYSNNEDLPIFNCFFYSVSRNGPDELGMRLADVTLPMLWRNRMDSKMFPNFIVRSIMIRLAKVIFSHYLVNFVVEPWTLDMSKRAELWAILGETRRSLVASPPKPMDEKWIEKTNSVARKRLVKRMKDSILTKIPNPKIALEQTSPFELLRARAKLSDAESITKEVSEQFLLTLFDEQITYDTLAAFIKGEFPDFRSGALTDDGPLEGDIEEKISNFLTPLKVLEKYDFITSALITKYIANHVVQPWTMNSQTRAELIYLLARTP